MTNNEKVVIFMIIDYYISRYYSLLQPYSLPEEVIYFHVVSDYPCSFVRKACLL